MGRGDPWAGAGPCHRASNTRAPGTRRPVGGCRSRICPCRARALSNRRWRDRPHLPSGSVDRDGATGGSRRSARRVLRPSVVCGDARRGDLGGRRAVRCARRRALERARGRQSNRPLSGDSADERCAGGRALDGGRGGGYRHQPPFEPGWRSRDERRDRHASQSPSIGTGHRRVSARAPGADVAGAPSHGHDLCHLLRAGLRHRRDHAAGLLRIATRRPGMARSRRCFRSATSRRTSVDTWDGCGQRTRPQSRSHCSHRGCCRAG